MLRSDYQIISCGALGDATTGVGPLRTGTSWLKALVNSIRIRPSLAEEEAQGFASVQGARLPSPRRRELSKLTSRLRLDFRLLQTCPTLLRATGSEARSPPNWKFCSVLLKPSGGPNNFSPMRLDLWLIRVCDLSHTALEIVRLRSSVRCLGGIDRCTRQSFWPSA